MVNYWDFKVNLDKALISLATGILNLHVLNQQSDCIINKLAGLFGFFLIVVFQPSLLSGLRCCPVLVPYKVLHALQ